MYLVGLLVAVQLAPGPLAGQAPGGAGRPEASRARAIYKARLLEELNNRLRRWQEAWNEDDTERLSDFYHDDVVFRPPRSGALKGKDVVRQYLDLALPISGEIQLGVSDIEGSGRFAYLAGRWQHAHEGRIWTGQFVMLLDQGGGWRIRGHYFTADPQSDTPGLPALGAGGSEFEAIDVGAWSPDVRSLMDRISGAWLTRDPVRTAELWSEEMVYGAESGERAMGKVPALDLWSHDTREGMTTQDIVLDFAESGRFAFAFGQQIRTWSEDGVVRTRGIPTAFVFFRSGDVWQLRSLILLSD